MKTIDTLVEDIYQVLDPKNDHEVSEDNLEFLGETVKNVVRDFMRKNEKSGKLRFSAIGKHPRQLWYNAHPDPEQPPEAMPPQAMMKFLYGHLIEAAVLFLAKEAGHDVSCEQMEVESEGVLGHIDAIIDDHVVDVKSTSPFAFKKFAAGELQPEDDSFGYLWQLSGYANVLGKPAAFLAVDKVGGGIALSPISRYTVEGHAPRPRIRELKAAIADDQVPPRCAQPVADGKSGNMQLPTTPCGYCEHKWRCHPGLRAFAYSGGPRFLTAVVRQPDVPEFGRP